MDDSFMRRRVLSLKAWGSLCKPKEMGGLGLRRMREVNLALISKLGWNLLNNIDLMWVSQLHCKYLSSSSFLSPSSFLLPLGYGKASLNPFLLSLKEPTTEFIASPFSLFGAPLGFPAFPPSLIPLPLGLLNLFLTCWSLTFSILILFSLLQLGTFPF
jgi:hypothetical protein